MEGLHILLLCLLSASSPPAHSQVMLLSHCLAPGLASQLSLIPALFLDRPARGGAWCAARPDPAPSQTSHAITLQKTVEYITKLQQERSQMQEEARRLREEIEELNATIL